MSFIDINWSSHFTEKQKEEYKKEFNFLIENSVKKKRASLCCIYPFL